MPVRRVSGSGHVQNMTELTSSPERRQAEQPQEGAGQDRSFGTQSSFPAYGARAVRDDLVATFRKPPVLWQRRHVDSRLTCVGPADPTKPVPFSMDWLAFGLGAVSIGAVPMAWVVIFLCRRNRSLAYHNTTPPTPIVTTGQRR